MKIGVSVEQIYRPQPGGVATYVRGLLSGLVTLADSKVVALGPRSLTSRDLPTGVGLVATPYSLRVLTLWWWRRALGVPADLDVVHATTLAGPFGGGSPTARRSVALHDLLWRDRPEDSTRRGVQFHERRLRAVLASNARLIVTSPRLPARLDELGVEPSRVFRARLGRDDGPVAPASRVEALLKGAGVQGPYCVYVGTREPRKNLARLLVAHHEARRIEPELGPLVLIGPSGWGDVETGDAVVLGSLEREVMLGVVRDACVAVHVALDEGWGLPPVEALGQGTVVVASSAVPSVENNDEVVHVEASSVESIRDGLRSALGRDTSASGRAQRVASVSDLTWTQCALDHLAAWQ